MRALTDHLAPEEKAVEFQARPADIKRHLCLLLVASSLAYSMFFFVDRLWSPGKSMHFSDLYARWYGSRELLLRGRDPYSLQITHEIQMWSYGHRVEQDDSEIHDENRFAYPLYIVFVMAPLVGLSFPETYGLLRILLPLISIGTVLLWLRAIGWKPGLILLTCIVVLSVSNFPMLESLYLQQPVLVAMVFLAGACAALRSDRQYLSGALLALATMKPQDSVLFVTWILFWASFEWRSRKGIVVGFLVTFILLVGGAELLLPGWISEFVAGLIAYQHYTGTFSILTLVFGRVAGLILTSGLILAISWIAWQTRREPFGSPRFYLAFSSVLVAMIVTAPTMYPTGQVVLLPVILLMLKDSHVIWAEGRWVRLMYVSVMILLTWPWATSLIIMAVRPFISLQVLQSRWLLVLAPFILLPSSLLLFLATRLKLLTENAHLMQAHASVT